jgi:hypothetical protein
MRPIFLKGNSLIALLILVILISHFILDGFEKENGFCLLCELLVISFINAKLAEIQLFFPSISLLFLLKPFQPRFSPYFKTRLRAPPAYFWSLRQSLFKWG